MRKTRKTAILLIVMMTAIAASAQRHDREIERWIEAAEADTTDWQTMAKIGRYYREHSNTHKAALWTERALSLHQSDTLKKEMAMCHFNRGAYGKCLDMCRELLNPTEAEVEPDSSALYIMARCFEKMEMPDSTIAYQQMTAEYDIENQANIISFARNLISMQMTKDAIWYLDRYCAIDSSNVSVVTTRAFAYYQAGQPSRAIEEYEKAIEMGNCSASTFFHLGMAYSQKRNMRKALENLTKAEEESGGNNAVTKARLGIVQLEFEETAEQGLSNIYKAIELMQPDTSMMFVMYYTLGDYYVSHDKKKATDMLLKAQSYKDGTQELTYLLSYSYMINGDTKNEIAYLRKFLAMADDNTDPFTLERVKNRLKKHEEEMFMKGEKQ